MKKFLIYSLGQLILSPILFFILINHKNEIIIRNGIITYKLLNGILIINIILFLITFIGFVFLYLFNKIKQNNKNKEDSIDLDENVIINKLKSLKSDSNYLNSIEYINKIIEQINMGRKLENEFIEIQDNNNLPIIINISKELKSIRYHLLEDAKSIYKRIVISKETEKIVEKLKHNDKLLEDAENLILEALNYIDIKTSTTETDLKNLTESLQDLIKLI